MRFSLIVCTLGRSKEIAELFLSLVRQNRTDFEVILVDQNKDTRLVEIAANFAGQFPLTHIRNTGTGCSLGRNIGLDHANGELIGFPDDDCQYLAGYLDTVHRVFVEDSSIGCITGYPTDNPEKALGNQWNDGQMDLDSTTVLNRCQEFTTFARRQSIGDIRYNERLGVGAQTLWGTEEGPDFLIRFLQTGARVVYFPNLFVYHPNKITSVNRATLQRAAGYSRGRGCLYRLHPFPITTVFNSIFRPAAGSLIYLFKLQPMRSAYYFTIFIGTLRGLFMSKREFEEVRNCKPASSSIKPLIMAPLSEEPLVSVLIANYNYARFLPAALDSLRAQSYSNWEAIVCDDGSTDNSIEVIERYSNEDSRIRIMQQSNGGQNSAYNACYELARGEVICLLDADDTFEVNKIQKVVEAFRAHPEAGLCNHLSQVIDADGKPHSVTMHRLLDSGWLGDKALSRGACVYVPTTSCMSFRPEIGDLLFPVTARQERDLDGYLAMVAQFLTPFCVIDEKLSSYRIHGKNMGGLTEPTPDRLHYELRLITERTGNVKDFVQQRFGKNIADWIVLEDNPQYLQAALKLLSIERQGEGLQQAHALIARLPSAKWRTIWRIIFAFPASLSRSAVPWMHRSHRAKSLVHGLLGREKTATI